MNGQARPCSACHGQRTGIVTERFRTDIDAFRRHTELVRHGRSPSLCIQRDGSRNVCHLAEPAARPRISEAEDFFLVADAVEVAAHT